MQFTSFYGLAFNPFTKEGAGKEQPYESRDFKSAKDVLKYLVDAKGIGTVTAEPGMGKTYALHRFMNELSDNTATKRYIGLSTVTVGDFYTQLCDELGVEAKGGKSRRFNAIQDQILYLYKEKKKPLVLVIDEAQYLNQSILNDLKMLMNFVYDSFNCFTFILCGEPALNATMSRRINDALYQRLTAHYEFSGLSDEEGIEYIKHKISGAGGSESIIEDTAIVTINTLCEHNPRKIDLVMDNALKVGYLQHAETINNDIVMAAFNERKLS